MIRRSIILVLIVAGVGLSGYNFFIARNINANERTLIYACGYVSGQAAIMVRLPMLFPTDVPEPPAHCLEIARAAAATGFDPGAKK